MLLAAATKHITPVSSKPGNANANVNASPNAGAAPAAAAAAGGPTAANKEIAMKFVSASKEVQAQMLKDPSVARAILQTLAESPGGAPGGLPPQMASMLGGAAPAAPGATPPLPPPPATIMAPGAVPMQTMMAPFGMPPAPVSTMPATSPAVAAPAAAPAAAPPAWTGVITLARNMAKKTPYRASLIQGKVADVEVVLRSAAGNSNVIDITHRVPFEEAVKKVAGGSILSLVPNSMMEQASFEEYSKYFRSKHRAGVARLDGQLALYVMPAGEDIAALKDSLYALGPHIPRAGALIGLIAEGTAAVNSRPAVAAPVGAEKASKAAAKQEQAAPVEPPPAEAPAEKAAEKAEEKEAPAADAGSGDAAEDGVGMSSNELMDLFSNPDLIKLLSNEDAA